MSTALNDQDFPDGVSSDDRLDVFASHYAGAAAFPGPLAPGSSSLGIDPGRIGAAPSTFPTTRAMQELYGAGAMTRQQADRCAAALEEAQKLRAELQKRDQQISRTTDVLGIVKWLCLEVDAFLPDADGKTHAEALHHIHTLIGLI